MTRFQVVVSLLLSMCFVFRAAADEDPIASPSDDYTAYWLVSDERGVREEYELLLLTRVPLAALRQYSDFRGLTERLAARDSLPADALLPRAVPLLDSPAIVITTYRRDSIWNVGDGPIQPIGRVSAYDASTRKITVDAAKYRIEDAAVKDVVHLLKHPRGTISIHRLRGPLTGFEQTAKALTLLLEHQEEEQQEKPAEQDENVATEKAKVAGKRGVEVFLAIVPLDAAKVDPLWLSSDFTWFSYRSLKAKELGIAMIVRNGTEAALPIPRKFDGKALRLLGAGDDDLTLRLLSTSLHEPSDTVDIGPGETEFAFNLPLYDLMESPAVEATPPTRPKWVWSWWARPKPPPSPVYHPHGGHVESAVLWAELEVGGQIFRTAPKTLRVSEQGASK